MSQIFLALYLIIVGLSILFGLSLPSWIAGLLALIAGVLMLFGRFGLKFDKKAD
jgi:urea transporter